METSLYMFKRIYIYINTLQTVPEYRIQTEFLDRSYLKRDTIDLKRQRHSIKTRLKKQTVR